MPLEALQAVRAFLARDSRPGAPFGATIDYLMDRLFYGEFHIFEQVSSSPYTEQVKLIGLKDPGTGAAPLWLVGRFGSGEEPTPARWRQTEGDPLCPRIDVDRGLLYGLGAANAKVDLLLKLLAASRVDTARLKRPICLIALSGDESHGLSLEAMTDGRIPMPSAAILSAPTNLELCTEHPGSVTLRLSAERTPRHRRMPAFRGIVELVVKGRSGHVQASCDPADALARGLALLNFLRKEGELRVLSFSAGEGAQRYAGECRMQLATSFEELPPLPSYVEVSHLPDGAAVPLPIDKMLQSWLRAHDAGLRAVRDSLGVDAYGYPTRPRVDAHTGWLRSARERLSGELTLWTGPGVDQGALIEAFMQAVSAQVRARDENHIEVAVMQRQPCFEADTQPGGLTARAQALLRGAGLPATYASSPFTTDAGYLAERGIPALVFGPGRGLGDLYRDDEHTPLHHLNVALAAYQTLIEGLCC